MRMLAAVLVLAFSGLCAPASQAKEAYFKTFLQKYQQYAGPLQTRGCANCHNDDFTLNPYGKAVSAEKTAEGQAVVTDSVLSKIENLDSDGDGSSNIDEIKAGTAPGDPTSKPSRPVPAKPAAGSASTPTHSTGTVHPGQPSEKPTAAASHGVTPPPHPGTTPPPAPGTSSASHATAPPGGTTTITPTPAPTPSTSTGDEAAPAPLPSASPSTSGSSPAPLKAPAEPLVPPNFFHSAVVHFPIALFLAGLFLDLLGFWKKNQTLLYAGWYNLVLAAISAVAASATGAIATIRMNIGLDTKIGVHMLMALIASFIMWGMVALRVHRHEEMNAPARLLYFVLAFAGLVLISWAGHLGGEYVMYGG